MAYDFSKLQQARQQWAEHRRALAGQACAEFANVVVGRAQQLAPVGGGSHSPRDPHRGYLASTGHAEYPTFEGMVITVELGFNTVYAHAQETREDYGHDQGQVHYMRDAMANSAPQFVPYVAGRLA